MNLIRITAAIVAAALSCAFAAQAGVNIQPSTTSVTLKRGSTNVTPAPTTMAECEARKKALIEQDALSKTSGQTVYLCSDNVRTVATFTSTPAPKPTCTAPRPAVNGRPVQCPPGTVGTWTQTQEFEQAEYPTCWTAGEWLPASAPAGICAVPKQLVYACADAGADGRVLESSSVSWPNCQNASWQEPRKSLVVATNAGAWPFQWRLASKVTTQRIWSQIGGVDDWRTANAITWAVEPMPLLGSATIEWTAPTKNTDGTALTDLAGFRIVYGTNAAGLTRIIELRNASLTRYVVDQLAPATWYFGVKAYSAAGVEAELSNVASKAIR